MSVEQLDVIDLISTDRWTGDVTLTVSDHLDWTDSRAHLLLLEAKINKYLAFIESGEILEQYPMANDAKVVLRVIFKYDPDEAGRSFISGARALIEAAGFSLIDRVSPHPEATFN